MSHTTSLLRRVRVRIATVGFVEDLQTGAAAGGALGLGVLVAGRFGWAWGDVSTAAAVAAAATVLHPVVGLVLNRADRRTVAAAADERLGLRERVSTALWCGDAAGPGREPLGRLVVEDAESTAARVGADDLRRAFRPRLLRRPLVAAGAAVVACGALALWQPAAQAVETPEQKLARLAEENRVAEVARKLEAAAKVDEQKATERKQEALAAAARSVRKAAEQMQKEPPRREAALAKLNEMAKQVQEAARKSAGMTPANDTPEADAQNRALEDLLRQLSEAGLESLQKDLSDLEKRLKDDPKGNGAPSPSDLRDLAARMDALRNAMQRAQEAGADDLAEALRTIGNEDLLEKIAQRLREIASKMDAGNYEGLDSGEGEAMDLSTMSREELEELLKQLDELAAMDDLAKALQGGGSEARGGKKLKLGPGGGT